MNLSNIKLFLIAISFMFFINCKENDKKILIKKGIVVNEIKENYFKTIDSLALDLNDDGKFDKISIREDYQKNRLLMVELKDINSYKLISSNNQIIGCLTCGYQTGDPYIGLNEIENGFEIEQEHIKMSFIYQQNKILLKKLDVLITKQTENGIEEEHQILSMDKFGKIELFTLIENFEVDLFKKYFKNELVESYILKSCENSRFKIQIEKNDAQYLYKILDETKIILKGVAFINKNQIKLGKIEGTLTNSKIIILNYINLKKDSNFIQCDDEFLTFEKQ